jgi:PAS domain S-box-containing protein
MKRTAKKAGSLILLTQKDSEVRYRRLFEATQDGILILDAKTGMIEDVNPYLIKMLGYSRKEFLKKRLWEVGAFKDFEASQDAFEALQEKEYIRYEDLPLKGKNGRLIQVEFVSNIYLVGGKKVIQCNIRDITERKQAEAAQGDIEERYRSTLESMMEGCQIIGYDWRYLFINDSAAGQGKLNKEELLGHTMMECYPGIEKTDMFAMLQRCMDERTSHAMVNEFIYPEGSKGWFELSIQPVPTGIFILSIDITERKRAEQEIVSLAKFPSENPNPVLRLSQDGIVMYANSASGALLGMWGCAVGGTAPQLWHDLAAKTLASRENKTVDIECDGKIYSMDITPVTEPGYVNLYGRDITERKERKEQMTRLNMAVNNSGEAIFMTDREGVITFVNPGFTQLYGYTADEIVGKTTPRILKSGVTKPEDYAAFWQILLNKQVAKGELTNKTKDGPLLTIDSWSSPILNQQEEVIGFLSLQRDITQRKQREEEIKSRNEELTTLYQLSRLLADASDLERVFELVNRHAVESVHATFACLALLEDGELVMRAVYPVRSLDHDFNVGGRRPIPALPCCQHVLEQNEPVILQANNSEVSGVERTTLLLDLAQSICLVPLRVNGDSQGLSDALGLLILGEAREEKRETFTPEKIRLARSIGDQAASAIRRLVLHEQSGRRLQHLASLSEIDRTIASNFDLRVSLQLILKHVIEQLEVDAADVLVFNTRIQALEFADGLGFRSNAIERKKLRLGESQAGQAALERRIVQIPDVATSGAVFAQPELLEAENVAAYFAVPLITKGQVKGVLEIFQHTSLEPNREWLDFLNTLAGQAAIAIDVVQLFDSLQRSNVELTMAYDATIEGWSHALDLRDKETEGHTQRVTEMTVNLGRAFGLSDEELVQVRWGALLHDIGKMGVPDGILLKPGPLTDEEWVAMKKHPGFAYEMLSPIHYLRAALDIPYCHHEKWDGTGYPRGLKGEQIPLVARIFAVVDVWDALTSDRPYRAAWPEEKVLDHIRSLAGTHFDPQVVKICLESGLLKGR